MMWSASQTSTGSAWASNLPLVQPKQRKRSGMIRQSSAPSGFRWSHSDLKVDNPAFRMPSQQSLVSRKEMEKVRGVKKYLAHNETYHVFREIMQEMHLRSNKEGHVAAFVPSSKQTEQVDYIFHIVEVSAMVNLPTVHVFDYA